MQLLTEAQERALKKVQAHAPQGTWIPASIVVTLLGISPRTIGELTDLGLLVRKAKSYRLPGRALRALEMGAFAAVPVHVEPDHCEGEHEGVRVSMRFSRPVRRADLPAAGQAVGEAFESLVRRVKAQA